MKVAFLGTPQIAVASLDRLVQSRHEVVAVLTRPDRPAGRHRSPSAPAVKVRALELGIDVLQPEKAKESVDELRRRDAQVCAVVAYGGWLPPAVLEATPGGCVNVHPSLLPRWRGAAPVERAIMAGDRRTGVTTMQIDEGLDTGPLLMQAETAVGPEETAGELGERLGGIGAGLLAETITALEAGTLVSRAQDDGAATYAEKLEPDACRVDWSAPAAAVDGLIRGANPRPGAWTTLDGRRLKLWRSRLVDTVDGPGLRIACGDGTVEILELQPDGKPRMTAQAWLAGHRGADLHFD